MAARKPKEPEAPAPEAPAPEPVEEEPKALPVRQLSDNFDVNARKVRSSAEVEIKLVGWVGDGFKFPAELTQELIDTLIAVEAKLP